MTAPKIVSLQARAVNVPLEYPIRTSVGIVDTSPLVLIDLHTDQGAVGRAYVFTYTPLALEATRRMILSLGELWVGQFVAPVELERRLAARLRLLGKTGLAAMACAGLDMAAWDALAIARRVPLVELLGGQRRLIPAYDSHSMDGEVLGVERASRAAAQGFRAIKTKLGYASLAEDLSIVRALRKAAGDEVALFVDYNQSLAVPDAVTRIRALAAEGVAWVEEPTLQEDYAGHAHIRRTAEVPIQMGENWFGPEEMAKALAARATDLAMPDAMKIGGVTGWLRASALAHAYGIPMSSHIFQEVSCHLLAVTPTAHWLERMDLAGPILAQPLRFRDGMAEIPDEPGCGLAWNEEAVQQFAV